MPCLVQVVRRTSRLAALGVIASACLWAVLCEPASAANHAPVPRFALDVSRATPSTVRVVANARRSYDPDGRIVRYRWRLNGHRLRHCRGHRCVLRSRGAGVQRIGLTVVDNDARKARKVRRVHVSKVVRGPKRAKGTMPPPAGPMPPPTAPLPPQQPDPSLTGEPPPTPLNPDDNFIADWSNASPGIATYQGIEPFADLLQEAPERSQFESAPVRQSDLSLHMTVNQNDTDNNGSTERTQLFPRYYLSDQDDVWMSMSFWLDHGFAFPANGGEWGVILDGFPNTPDLSHKGRNAVLELLLSSGSGSGPQWKLIVRGGVSTDDGNTYPRNEGYGLGPATTDNWVDFLVHYKLSTGSDGEVKVWRAPGNAQFPTNPVASDFGVNVATASGIPLVTYPEFGLYRSTSSTPSSLHIGGVAITQTRGAAEALFSG